MDRRAVNNDEIFAITKELLTKAKGQGLTCVVGGAISTDSLDFLRRLPGRLLDRFETRKICFFCPQALNGNVEKGILKAVEFELLWLKNKRDFYKAISEEDEKRIQMMEERFSGHPRGRNEG
jgi:hypothetical protein